MSEIILKIEKKTRIIVINHQKTRGLPRRTATGWSAAIQKESANAPPWGRERMNAFLFVANQF